MAKKSNLDWANEGFDVPETGLPRNVETLRKQAKADYEVAKASNKLYFDALKLLAVQKGECPAGHVLVLKRMTWGIIRGIFAPASEAAPAKAAKRVLRLGK